MTTAQEIFESLIKDPNHFFLGEEAVKAEALRRVRQHHNNEKALSMGLDIPAVAKLAAFLQKAEGDLESQLEDNRKMNEYENVIVPKLHQLREALAGGKELTMPTKMLLSELGTWATDNNYASLQATVSDLYNVWEKENKALSAAQEKTELETTPEPPELSEDKKSLTYRGFDDWKRIKWAGANDQQVTLWSRDEPKAYVTLQGGKIVDERKTIPTFPAIKPLLEDDTDLPGRWQNVTETNTGLPSEASSESTESGSTEEDVLTEGETQGERYLQNQIVNARELLDKLTSLGNLYGVRDQATNQWYHLDPETGGNHPNRAELQDALNAARTTRDYLAEVEYVSGQSAGEAASAGRDLGSQITNLELRDKYNVMSNAPDADLKRYVQELDEDLKEYIKSINPGEAFDGWEDDSPDSEGRPRNANPGWGTVASDDPEYLRDINNEDHQLKYTVDGTEYTRNIIDVARSLRTRAANLTAIRSLAAGVAPNEPLTSGTRDMIRTFILPTVATADRPDKIGLGDWARIGRVPTGGNWVVPNQGEPAIDVNAARDALFAMPQYAQYNEAQWLKSLDTPIVSNEDNIANPDTLDTTQDADLTISGAFKSELTAAVQRYNTRTDQLPWALLKPLYENYLPYADSLAQQTGIDLKGWHTWFTGNRRTVAPAIHEFLKSDNIQRTYAPAVSEPPIRRTGMPETNTRPRPGIDYNSSNTPYWVKQMLDHYPIQFPPLQLEKNNDNQWVAVTNPRAKPEEGHSPYKHIVNEEGFPIPYDPEHELTFSEDADSVELAAHRVHAVDREYTLADVNDAHFRAFQSYLNDRNTETGYPSPYMFHPPLKNNDGSLQRPYIGERGLTHLRRHGLISHEYANDKLAAQSQNWAWTSLGIPVSQWVEAMHKFSQGGPETRNMPKIARTEAGEPVNSGERDYTENVNVVRTEPLRWIVNAWLGGNLSNIAISNEELAEEELRYKPIEQESARYYNAVDTEGNWISKPAEMGDDAWEQFVADRQRGYHPRRHYEALQNEQQIPKYQHLTRLKSVLRKTAGGKEVFEAGYPQFEDNWLPKSLALDGEESKVMYPRKLLWNQGAGKYMFEEGIDAEYDPLALRKEVNPRTGEPYNERNIETIKAILDTLRTEYKNLHTMYPGHPRRGEKGLPELTDEERNQYNEFFVQKGILEEWLKGISATFHASNVNDGRSHPRYRWRTWVFPEDERSKTDYDPDLMPLGESQDTWAWHQSLSQIGDAKSLTTGSPAMLGGIPNFSLIFDSGGIDPYYHFHQKGQGVRLNAHENHIGGFLGNLGFADSDGNLIPVPQQNRVAREWAIANFGPEWANHHTPALLQYNNLFRDAIEAKDRNTSMDFMHWLTSDAPTGSGFGKIHEVFANGQFISMDNDGNPVVSRERPPDNIQYTPDGQLVVNPDQVVSDTVDPNEIRPDDDIETIAHLQSNNEVEEDTPLEEVDSSSSNIVPGGIDTGTILGEAATEVPIGRDAAAYEAFFPEDPADWVGKKVQMMQKLIENAGDFHAWYRTNALRRAEGETEESHIPHYHGGEAVHEIAQQQRKRWEELLDLPNPRDDRGVLGSIPINTWNILFGNQSQNINGLFKRPTLEDINSDGITIDQPELSEHQIALGTQLNQMVQDPNDMPRRSGGYTWVDNPDLFKRGSVKSDNYGTWEWDPEANPTDPAVADSPVADPPPLVEDRNTKMKQILRHYILPFAQTMKNTTDHLHELGTLKAEARNYKGLNEDYQPLDPKDLFFNRWLKEYESKRKADVDADAKRDKLADIADRKRRMSAPTTSSTSTAQVPATEQVDEEDEQKDVKELRQDLYTLFNTVHGHEPDQVYTRYVEGDEGHGDGWDQARLIEEKKALEKLGVANNLKQNAHRRERDVLTEVNAVQSLVADEEMKNVPQHQIRTQMRRLIFLGHTKYKDMTPATHKLMAEKEEELRKISAAQGYNLDNEMEKDKIIAKTHPRSEDESEPWNDYGSKEWFERVSGEDTARIRRQDGYKEALKNALDMRTDENYHPHIGVMYNPDGTFKDFLNTQTFETMPFDEVAKTWPDIKFNEDTFYQFHGIPSDVLGHIKELDRLEALTYTQRQELFEQSGDNPLDRERKFQEERTFQHNSQQYQEARKRIEAFRATNPKSARETFFSQFYGGDPEHGVSSDLPSYFWPVDEGGQPEEPPMFHDTAKNPKPMRGIYVPELGAFVNPARLTNLQQDLIDHVGPGNVGMHFISHGSGHYGVDEGGDPNPAEPQYALAKLTQKKKAQLAANGNDDQSIMVNHTGKTATNDLGGVSFANWGDSHTNYLDADHYAPQTINSVIEHGVGRHITRDMNSEMLRDPQNNKYVENGEYLPMARWFGQPNTTLNKMFLQLETAVNLGRVEGSALHRRGYRYEPEPWFSQVAPIPWWKHKEGTHKEGRNHKLRAIPRRAAQYFMHPIDWTKRTPTFGPVGREGKRFGFFGSQREGQGGKLTPTERGQGNWDYKTKTNKRAWGMLRHGRVSLQRWAKRQQIIPSTSIVSAFAKLITGGTWAADQYVNDRIEEMDIENRAIDAGRQRQRGTRGSDGRWVSDDFVPHGEQLARNEDLFQLQNHLTGRLQYHNTSRAEAQGLHRDSKTDDLPKGDPELFKLTKYHNDKFIEHKKASDSLKTLTRLNTPQGVLPTAWPQVNDLYNQFIVDGPQKREKMQDYQTALLIPEK